MTPRTRPKTPRDHVRMLVLDPHDGSTHTTRADHLGDWLQAGDLLVVNDAATLPASLHDTAQRLEVRLTGPPTDRIWRAVVFGAGDWHLPTEERAAPPRLDVGHRFRFGADLWATVARVSDVSPRLVEIIFDLDDPDALLAALYAAGRPVQYSYQSEELALWSVQTVYGGRPWAAEMPSAGRPLTTGMLMALRRRGVEIAWITHAAGLSATGDPDLDAALPLEERYAIPGETVAAVRRTRRRGGRVFAVGTTVVRALEGCALRHGGRLVAEESTTNLRIGPDLKRCVVDGLLSGMHEETESHFGVLRAFASLAALRHAVRAAGQAGFRSHEFGDSFLILPAKAPRMRVTGPSQMVRDSL